MPCNICGSSSERLFETLVLKKHRVDYFRCASCGFIQTEKPYWLDDAYKNAINTCDTGLLGRNIRLSKTAALLLPLFFRQEASFLDYAGGYGIFTRLMRDIGFDFYWYDPFCQNLFARGFEYDPEKSNEKKIEMLTAFEVFEHLADPRKELAKMLAISKNILFSTDLVPEPVPQNPNKWWYYAPEHGQHISFYTKESLSRLAKENGLYYYTDGKRLHLFTDRKLTRLCGIPFSFTLIKQLKRLRLPFFLIKRSLRSKTQSDSEALL